MTQFISYLGNVYTAEYRNNVVRKITVSTGVITRFAGTGEGSYSGDGSQATSATIQNPHGLAIDASGINNTTMSFITFLISLFR